MSHVTHLCHVFYLMLKQNQVAGISGFASDANDIQQLRFSPHEESTDKDLNPGLPEELANHHSLTKRLPSYL